MSSPRSGACVGELQEHTVRVRVDSVDLGVQPLDYRLPAPGWHHLLAGPQSQTVYEGHLALAALRFEIVACCVARDEIARERNEFRSFLNPNQGLSARRREVTAATPRDDIPSVRVTFSSSRRQWLCLVDILFILLQHGSR